MIEYIGHKANVVNSETRLNYNSAKSWKYGYNKEFDIIVISKDGTLGDVFFVNGIHIGLPSVPKDRKEIINWDKTEVNQKWKRKEMPKGLNSKTQYETQYEEYIEQEFKRRREGVFIYLKGQVAYMPGSSYYFYQWNRLDEGYPQFRIIQNELLLYWEACKADFRCYGICYVKNRRFGWTSLNNSEHLEEGSRNEDKEIGIISKTGRDAKKMFDKLVRTFKKLPAFFLPVFDGTTAPKTSLNFTAPTKKKKNEDEEEEDGLDTIILWHNTVINAMDGDKMFRSSIDEAGKFPKEVPLSEYWQIVKTSHRQGKRVVGKCMMGSTVNSKKKGGAEFEKVYKDSDPLKRNLNDQTKSGLYRLLIPTKYCLEGFFDQYGYSIVEDPEKPIKTDLGEYTKIGASTHIKNDLEGLKDDPEAKNEYLRQNPDNERDAFRDESSDCEFNLVNILEQLDHNNHELEESELGNNDIERGNFGWKGGIQDSEVIWNPDPENGRFWLRKDCHPTSEFRNQKEMKWKNGINAWSPIGGHLGSFGVDPYNRDKSADGRGSKGAIHLVTKMNTSNLPNDKCILEYLDRARKVTIFFEEVLMAMVYYSIPMLSELSNEAFLQYIADRGYRHYSLNNPFKRYLDLNPTEKKLGGAPPQNAKIADQQFYAVEAMVEDHIGVAKDNRNREKGEIGDFPFSRTLTQVKDVDLTDRTKYDAYISLSLALLGNQKATKIQKQDKKINTNPFRRYNNSGKTSKHHE